MSNDIVMILALLKNLKLLTKKEATQLYDELKYKNLSSSVEDAFTLIEDIFEKHLIGQKNTSTDIKVGGKTIKVTK